jgi:hypothetical protein
MTKQSLTESTVREIRRKTRKKYSAEEKIRIVLEGRCSHFLQERRFSINYIELLLLSER